MHPLAAYRLLWMLHRVDIAQAQTRSYALPSYLKSQADLAPRPQNQGTLGKLWGRLRGRSYLEDSAKDTPFKRNVTSPAPGAIPFA